MSRTRRRFSKEFKLETVKLVKEGARSIGEVARDLDLTESAVRNWVRQFDVDAGVREGVSTGELDELRRLRSENRQLRMERDWTYPVSVDSCGLSAPALRVDSH